jgi:hypothetical protein
LSSEALDELEDRYSAVIEKEVAAKIQEAHDAKAQVSGCWPPPPAAAVLARAGDLDRLRPFYRQATREHREHRLQLYTQRLRAQLAALRGEPARFPSKPSPKEE